MRARFGADGFEEVERADQVGLEIGARRVDGVAHACLRGEVDDHIGALSGYEVVQSTVFLDPLVNGAKGGRLQKHRLPPFLEAHIVIVGHRLEADHLIAMRQKVLGKVITDEVCRACDERLGHGVSYLRAIMARRISVRSTSACCGTLVVERS